MDVKNPSLRLRRDFFLLVGQEGLAMAVDKLLTELQDRDTRVLLDEELPKLGIRKRPFSA